MTNDLERQRWNDPDWARLWPKREQLTDHTTPFLLATAALQPGEAVLDIGCGGGKTAIAASARVGAAGRVTGADISAPLLALAARRAAEAGVTNVSLVESDMQTATLEGAPFDVAISQFGVMFFDEPHTAFANICQHLRPGGRLVFACWQPSEKNRWCVAPVYAPFAPPPAEPAPGKSRVGPFALGDQERVTEILEGAGFSAVRCEALELTVVARLESVVDEWQLAFNGVPDAQMGEAMQAVSEYFSQFPASGAGHEVTLAFQIFAAQRV